MGLDSKYGQVTTEHGDIGEDEPVVVFRARDAKLPAVLTYYRDLCRLSGSPDRHIDLIQNTRETVRNWQEEHPDQVRIPTSETSKEWMS